MIYQRQEPGAGQLSAPPFLLLKQLLLSADLDPSEESGTISRGAAHKPIPEFLRRRQDITRDGCI